MNTAESTHIQEHDAREDMAHGTHRGAGVLKRI
jgi:hypothetical protein